MDSNIVNFLNKFLTSLKLRGNMSEQGADEAGKDISFGIKFFFCCGGLAIFIMALAFSYYLIK
ncbi:hypothetical protein D3M78_00605 [Rodentibacter pneumotropicus]|uniref:Uncharacterized protein n=1 Tax=Rodentibacter pneumotropicus TaxID=758 RepID=A0A4S2Q4D7_9PAST|nr:hypothetical protein D3M78_00605 [Rodentibacter pneumotropicus]